MNARSHRLDGSLGDSWGDAEYESDGGASLHSVSELDSEDGSESYFEEHQDMATPLQNRVTRATSRTPQDTPVKTPANRVASRHSQTPTATQRSRNRSQQSTPGSESMEPSFIMPSMYQSRDSLYDESPLHHSNLRSRKPRGPSMSRCVSSSPRTANLRASTIKMPQPHETAVDENPGLWYYINFTYAYLIHPLLQYMFGILAVAAEFAKPLIAVAFIVWLLITTILGTSGYVKNTVKHALMPFCSIPGSSHILGICVKLPQEGPAPFPDFETVFSIQDNFQTILDASKDSSTLPADMKRSEGMVRDVRSLVKWSNLPSRHELEVELTSFIETAGEAVRALTKYNSKIHHTMDRLVSTSTWTQKLIQGIADGEASKGVVPKFFKLVNPLSVFISPAPTLEQQIFDTFLLHVSRTKEDIEALIGTSEGLLALLAHLDSRLDLIGDIANRDDLHISKGRDELLAQLWSKLGGNSDARKGFERSLTLLNNVQKYRRDAVMHVSATLTRLHEIEAGLENLREDVAAPEVLGLRDGLGLEYHLKNINDGVERMKKVRGESQTLEREALRKGLGGDQETLVLPGGSMPTVYARVH